MKNKYHAKKQQYYGIRFDSKLEADRSIILMQAVSQGRIRNLHRQVKYVLIPKQTEEYSVQLKSKNKTLTKVVERECSYYADFVYEKRLPNGTWETVVEDTKSPATRTPEYKIKRKLMLERYGIKIREVSRAGDEI